jgi:hypothetical protein
MLRFWKQKLDRWAINAAARALSAGKYDSARIRRAAELLADDRFLELPGKPADLVVQKSGAFQFRSNVLLELPRNDLVHGKLFRATGSWHSKPLVILVHGWNAELHYLYALPRVARALNRSGMNAALIELPLHLQRRPPRSASAVRDFISDDLATMLLATRQALADFHALAGWARAQGCPAVAIWGFSLGGWLAGLYICGETLASHAVLTTPIIDLERAVQELSFCHPVRAALAPGTLPYGRGSVARDASSELDLSRLNLTARKPRISPDHIHVSQCEYDLFVPPETYKQLAEAWQLPGARFCPQSHLTVLISRQSMRVTIDWLAQQLAPITRPSTHSAGA